MPYIGPKVDMKNCEKVEPVHPCDPKLPCDPFFVENDCPTPYICQERLKNPAYPGEITQCRTGAFMHVKTCAKVEPPHPFDPLQPCSKVKAKTGRVTKPPCQEPPICLQRVKNPDVAKKVAPCDPKK